MNYYLEQCIPVHLNNVKTRWKCQSGHTCHVALIVSSLFNDSPYDSQHKLVVDQQLKSVAVKLRVSNGSIYAPSFKSTFT